MLAIPDGDRVSSLCPEPSLLDAQDLLAILFAADRTITGSIADDLWMHGAGPATVLICDGLRLAGRWLKIGLRVRLKLLAAAGAAKEIVVARVQTVSGGRWIDGHTVYGINDCDAGPFRIVIVMMVVDAL